jgi:hydrogenase maturation protein HypF
LIRLEIKIYGIVQGVGFRPFIHKLVQTYDLNGWVKNTSTGVILEVEGERETLDNFIEDIEKKSPVLSVIERIETEEIQALMNYNGFEIIKSTETEQRDKFTLISPDVCICDECKAELFNKEDRRYKYPFINCTNCGPRFTIIKDIPYDRHKTTMQAFEMCQECKKEYTDINSRRYHAQPDCCYDCGPEVFFMNEHGEKNTENPIEAARAYIMDNKIIAIKGIGGIHLSCIADNKDMIELLRKRKHRDEKPFAIMCKDIDTVKKWCMIDNRTASKSK